MPRTAPGVLIEIQNGKPIIDHAQFIGHIPYAIVKRDALFRADGDVVNHATEWFEAIRAIGFYPDPFYTGTPQGMGERSQVMKARLTARQDDGTAIKPGDPLADFRLIQNGSGGVISVAPFASKIAPREADEYNLPSDIEALPLKALEDFGNGICIHGS